MFPSLHLDGCCETAFKRRPINESNHTINHYWAAQTELTDGFVCPIPSSKGPIFAWRSQVISGCLANISAS